MEELVSNGTATDVAQSASNPISEFLGTGDLSQLGLLGILMVVGGVLFFNWKASSSKSIKRRKKAYKETKAGIATEIVANQDRQAVVVAEFEEKVELSRNQEVKIEKIVEQATEQIKATMAENDPRVTVNSINSKWNRKKRRR